MAEENPNRVRVCILEADELGPEGAAHCCEGKGQYGEAIRRMLERALQLESPRPSQPSIECSVYNVCRGEYPSAAANVYFVSGSKADAFDAETPWVVRLRQFLRRVFEEEEAKILGICFGHQIIAHALGGRAGRADAGWGVGMHEHRLVPGEAGATGKPGVDIACLFGAAKAEESLKGSVRLVVSHRDQVLQLPPNASRVLTSAFCPYAGFVIGDRVFCVQGHPEFSVEYMRWLFSSRRALLGEELAAEALESLDTSFCPESVNRTAVAFLRFILGPSQ